MRRKITFLFFCLLTLSVTFFSLLGKAIRDYYSPHVEVMAPISYLFPDGSITMAALVNSCFIVEENGKTYAFLIEERSDSGESAYYTKKIELILGQSDDRYSEVKKAPILNALFICNTNQDLVDGERVVLHKIVNMP